jgi:hypothetical protein
MESETQRARYDIDTAVSLPWVKWPKSETDDSPQFSAGIKMRGAIPPLLWHGV